MVPVSRLATVGGVPLFSLLSKEEITAIEDRTRFGGGEIVKAFWKRFSILCTSSICC